MFGVLGQLWGSTESVGGRLAGVSWTALAIGLTIHMLKLAVRARALQNILSAAFPQQRIRYRDAAVPYFAGTGAGTLVPLGGGQLLVIALVRARVRDASAATVAGTLTVERALDVAIAASVLPIAVAANLAPLGSTHPLTLAAGAAVLGAAAAAASWLLRRHIAGVAAHFADGLRAMRSPKRYVRSVASWQIASWGLRIVALFWFLRAFHIPGGMTTALLVLGLQLLAGLVPFTPGGVGSQQALIAVALAGTASGTALVGFSAGSQVATMLLNLAIGGIVLAAAGPRVRLRQPALVPRAAPLSS
jgi:uncharacterized membrane protein YbhN (UPF0104 family)